MASIKLTGDTSGEITISAPAVAGTNTITLPASTGEITVGKGIILHYVELDSHQAQHFQIMLLKSTEFDTVDFESGVTFDTTNYRFTVPSGANGYYMINAMCQFRCTNQQRYVTSICIYL